MRNPELTHTGGLIVHANGHVVQTVDMIKTNSTTWRIGIPRDSPLKTQKKKQNKIQEIYKSKTFQFFFSGVTKVFEF